MKQGGSKVMAGRIALFILGVVLLSPSLVSASPSFEVAYGEARSNRAINFAAVSSGNLFDLSVVAGPEGAYRAKVEGESLQTVELERWLWPAGREPGFNRLEITGPGQQTMVLNVAVTVPATEIRNGRLNGYRIGSYPDTPLNGLAVYEKPDSFIEVHEEHRDLQISPRFKLGQFLCKQENEFPQYMLLRERLVLKLEYLLDRLNDAGYPVSDFHVMSGYRTPYYNTRIGNGRYSRHQWGGAADIFVDQHPRDGVMDDLNADGRIDKDDAIWLVKFIESLSDRADFKPFVGGLSAYGSTASHGPFVHVDVRGWPARW